jgi:hypothetical protein
VPQVEDGSVPDGPDRRTVAGADAPATTHGDPLLAASEGATEGTEGSRHGADVAGSSPDD